MESNRVQKDKVKLFLNKNGLGHLTKDLPSGHNVINLITEYSSELESQLAEKDKEIEINIPKLVDEFMDGFEDPFTRGEMFKSQTSAHSINIAYYFELAMEYALLHRQDLINNQKP